MFLLRARFFRFIWNAKDCRAAYWLRKWSGGSIWTPTVRMRPLRFLAKALTLSRTLVDSKVTKTLDLMIEPGRQIRGLTWSFSVMFSLAFQPCGELVDLAPCSSLGVGNVTPHIFDHLGQLGQYRVVRGLAPSRSASLIWCHSSFRRGTSFWGWFPLPSRSSHWARSGRRLYSWVSVFRWLKLSVQSSTNAF